LIPIKTFLPNSTNISYAILTGKEGRYLPPKLRPDYSHSKVGVRVVLGPDLEHFTENGIETFLGSTYTITPESDRMGYRLEGPVIEHSEKGPDIVTSPLIPGSVQVPGSGKPIVMMKDAQTTGGYAKIATVITADLSILAQSRPSAEVKFRKVTLEEAREVLKRREKTLEAIKDFLDGKLRAYSVKALGKEFITFAGKV
jgi:allophanate hydrolase subunit 2